MSVCNCKQWIVPGACLVVGYFAGMMQLGLRADPLTAPPAVATSFPMSDRIGANLWQEMSAEYRACCLQTYRLAGERLDCLMKAANKPARPAVIMDLDETVLDNSAFETYLYNNKLEYTDALWEVYEEKYPQDVCAVPGALEFIRKSEAQGVTVIYISNRMDRLKNSTIQALVKHGINVKDIEGRLGFKPDGGSSDKTARRAAFTAKYDVLLYIGDNLRDFSEVFAAPKLAKNAPDQEYDRGIAARHKATDDAACHWGVDWFVLPNSVYGEWEKLIGENPKARMRPTTMPTAGR